MREQLQDFREENAAMRQELRTLREDNRRMRERIDGQARPPREPANVTSLGRFAAPEEFVPPVIGRQELGGSTTQAEWAAPQRAGRAAGPDGAYRRRARPQPTSSIYGRGLEPEEMEHHSLDVRPSTPTKAAPAVDLGYVNSVSPEELDALPYGLVILDARGDVLFYNETESRLAGYDIEEVTGKNFFEDVAPCTRVKEFQGRFEDFVEGKLGRVTFFDFVFYFSHGTQKVLIGLSHGRKAGHYNVMMTRT
jgi:photoactive yellow protein